MKLRFLFLLIPFFICCCKSSKKDVYEFDPEKLEQNEIKLSEIAEDISYIPIDNNILIGLIYDNIEFVNNKIYLSVKDIGILAYNDEGKLVKKIGSIGRGPGEYVHSFRFTVDDKTETLYNYDTGEIIKVFSKSGRFLRSFSLKDYGVIGNIKTFNSNLFVQFDCQYENSDYEWILLDSLGGIVKKMDRKLPKFTTNRGSKTPIFEFRNTLVYFNNYTDTVFSVLPDLTEKANMIISTGNYRQPRDNLTREQIESKKFMFLSYIQETNKFYIIRYSLNGIKLALIEKSNFESYLIDLKYSDPSYHNGIANDLDGGYFFIPQSYYSKDDKEYLVGLLTPSEIKFRAASNEFKNTLPSQPEKKREFEKLANRLTDTDNPVLVIIKLRN